MNFASYFFSDKLALAMSRRAAADAGIGAGRLRAHRAHGAAHLPSAWGFPCRSLYYTPEPSPNAFATGRDPNHASVAFTAGILQLMGDRELEGVVAHELGHVLHRDILISSVAGTIAAAITALSRMAFWFGGATDDDDREGGNGIESIC